MPTVNVITNCPECDHEVELDFDVTFDRQWHDYGSTRAAEDLVEVELEGKAVCPECGAKLNTDAASDRAIEDARDYE
jgi:uncharacterized protein (UPF0212 family)